MGIKACVVAPFPPPYGGMAVQGQKLLDRLASEGIEVIGVPTNPSLPQYLAPVEQIPVLRTAVRTLVYVNHLTRAFPRASVIYFLSGFPNFFFWVTLPAICLARLFKVPFILNARGGDARRFFQRWAWLVGPVIRSMVTRVAVPSGYLAEVFSTWCRITPVLVPNIADLDQFVFSEKDRFRPRIIVARNLEPYYNVACAVRGFARIRKKYPQALLGIAGQGSLERPIRKLVSDLGLDGAVTFHGAVLHEKMPEVYQNYDIMVNTSVVDNFPGVILEAFASGLAVVTSGAGGIPFLVEDRVTGLVLSENTPEAVCRCCDEILENAALGGTLVAAARKKCRTFNWEHIRSCLLPLLEEPDA